MARTATSTTKAQVDELKRANEQLKIENIRLKARLEQKPKKSPWRGLVISLCVILATIVLVAGNVLFWAGSTLTNTDRYVATVKPLLADTAVQGAIANYTTTQIFNQVDVQSAVTSVLPPRADFLAPQLTTQLQGATEKVLQKRLASDKFQATWVNANRQAHQKLLKTIKSSKTTDGVINLQDVYNRLSQALSGTKLSFLAGKTLPKNAGSITVINAPWVPKARAIVNNINWLKPLSLALLALFAAVVIWLTRNRRRMVIILASVFATSAALTLIAMQILQDKVAAHAQPAYQAAAGNAAHIILQPLAHQTVAILAFSLLVIIIAWLTGPYRWASCTVSATRQYLTTPLHKLIFKRENGFTRWVAANGQILEWIIVAVLGFTMLLVRLSLGLVAIYGVAVLLLILIIETLTAPHSPAKR